MLMFSKLMLVLTVCTVVSVPPIATGAELPIRGGLEGIAFRFDCAPGAYLVGFDGRRGSWVDQLKPICANWLPEKSEFGRDTPSLTYGSSGSGSPFHQRCKSTSGIYHAAITMTEDENGREQFVRSFLFSCRATDAVTPNSSLTIGTKQHGLDYNHVFRCPKGEFATGIQGRAGQYLHAFGMICAPLAGLP